MSEKKTRYFFQNPESGLGWCLIDLTDKNLGDMLRGEVEERDWNDGDIVTLEFKSERMTDEEVEALPDL